MRKFFLGSKKDRDTEKAAAKASSDAKSIFAATVPESASKAIQDPSKAPPGHAEPGQTTQAHPTKQVAFVGVGKFLPFDSTPSLPPHHEVAEPEHGRMQSVPTRTASASVHTNMPIVGTISGAQLLQVPTHQWRRAASEQIWTDGRDPLIHVSPSLPSSPSRADLPRSGTEGESAPRSGTSMSHNTVASVSSYISTRQNIYAKSAIHHPNLAMLATYARDANNAVCANGIAQHLTWSEITDNDLVDNLGGRERTRQEVLFEMVCSEERYVQELIVSTGVDQSNFAEVFILRGCEIIILNPS